MNKTQDSDWFVFDVAETRQVRVTLSKPQREGSVNIELHTAEDKVDQATVPDEGANVTIGDTTEGPTIYYVRVSGELQTTTNYTVHIESEQTDAFEPNQRRQDAVPLNRNETVTGEITRNDADWFELSTAPGDRFLATLTKPNGTATDLSLELYTAEGMVTRTSIGDDTTQGILADTATDRTRYFVRVAGESDDDLSQYTLTINATPTDAFEPNENRIQASPIRADEPRSGVIEIRAHTPAFP